MPRPEMTRRALLGSALGGVLAGSGVFGLAFAQVAVPSAAMQRLGFAGPQTLLLTVEARALIVGPPAPVDPAAQVGIRPDATDRMAGAGTLDGVPMILSAAVHLTAPRLARPWPIAVPGPLTQIGAARHAVDDPAAWAVTVGDAPVAVRRVLRRTVPIRSDRVERQTFLHDLRHSLTLELASPVPDGATVAVSGPAGIALSAQRNDSVVSEVIHVAQAGYALAGPKRGHLGLWLGHDSDGQAGTTDDALAHAPRWIVTGPGGIMAEGRLTLAKSGSEPHQGEVNFNGCDIWEADFSNLTQPGTYRLEVEGAGSSVPFRIETNPILPVLQDCARFLFHKRSGIAITAPHGGGVTRPRNDHPEDGLTVWQTDVRLGPLSEGFGGGPLPFDRLTAAPAGGPAVDGPDVPAGSPNPHAWGGWHDAADWDRRIQHAETVAMLADAVALFPTARALDLNLPESGRSFADPSVLARKDDSDRGDGRTILPDLIHEALWGLSLWRRTQRSDGGILGGVEYSRDWILGSVSWNPVQTAYAYAPEPWAAFLFAQAAAKLGHVIGTVCGDEVLAAALAAEATRAWDWAEPQFAAQLAKAEGQVAMEDDESAGVPVSLIRARTAAAASLYRATGHAEARAAFEAVNPFLPQDPAGDRGTRPGILPYASVDYVRAGDEGHAVIPALSSAIRDWATRAPDRLDRMGRDYGLHTGATYPRGRGWLRFGPGSNWPASVIALARAAGGEPGPEARDAVLEGMWFALGCNPANVSFVIGHGIRDFGDPLRIDRAGLPPVPGTLVFGVAGGDMHRWERDRVGDALYPADQSDWPAYAQVFESGTVAICAEHGVRGVMIEWLFAAAFAHDLLTGSEG